MRACVTDIALTVTLQLLSVNLDDFAMVINAGSNLEEEQEPCFDLLAYLCVRALQIQDANFELLSDRIIAVKVNERLKLGLNTLKDSLE
jgi:hypothetical protein